MVCVDARNGYPPRSCVGCFYFLYLGVPFSLTCAHALYCFHCILMTELKDDELFANKNNADRLNTASSNF